MGVPPTREGIMQKLYLTEQELAVRVGRSIGAVRRWRKLGLGPSYTKLGPRLIAYQLSAVEAWEAASTVTGAPPSSKPGAIAA
jgi:predicted DNA-binding transcriptional regulator AlpA